jgi:hypothetical protein
MAAVVAIVAVLLLLLLQLMVMLLMLKDSALLGVVWPLTALTLKEKYRAAAAAVAHTMMTMMMMTILQTSFSGKVWKEVAQTGQRHLFFSLTCPANLHSCTMITKCCRWAALAAVVWGAWAVAQVAAVLGQDQERLRVVAAAGKKEGKACQALKLARPLCWPGTATAKSLAAHWTRVC